MKPYNERLQMIDEAINSKRGTWNSFFDYLLISTDHNKVKGKGVYTEVSTLEKAKAAYPYWEYVCSKEEYLQRAKELGWVNGYRWGVVYKNENHGKDLPVDLEISITLPNWFGPGSVWLTGCNPTNLQDSPAYCFKITDERYKPEGGLWDELSLSEEAYNALKGLVDYFAGKSVYTLVHKDKEMKNDWHKKGKLPPVGAVVRHKESGKDVEIKCHLRTEQALGERLCEPLIEIGYANDFEPIRNETDKLQQDILNFWNNKGEDCPIPEWELANHLYSLGYRKAKPMSEDEFMQNAMKYFEMNQFTVSQFTLIGEALCMLHSAGCRFIDQEE